jgi:4-hydroxythreonine-4-phosphate dehydrogenase
VVTGPISKEAVNMAGHQYAGHTEIFAEYTGTKNFGMLLCGGGLRVIHVTTHVSLRQACDLITRERVLKTIVLAARALKLLGKEGGKIAMAGLNPHCSENGLFGSEEEKEITPAVRAARAEGLNVKSPIPAGYGFCEGSGRPVRYSSGHVPRPGPHPFKAFGFQNGLR